MVVLLDALRADAARTRRECEATIAEIDAARAVVERCHGCGHRPIATVRRRCPVSASLHASRLFDLIWDRAPDH